MTKLIVTRAAEWNNKAREFGIYLNEKKIGTIADGETKEFEIKPGNHKINGKVDWCKSPILEFDITEKESKEFQIAGYKHGQLIMRISLAIILVYFLLKHIFEIEWGFLIYFVAIGLLFNLFYITFGKNRYLRLIALS